MSREKGQSLIEFALIIPFFFAMCFGMIYGGIMFLDYLQYNNASRAVAREISLTTTQNDRDKMKADFENKSSERINQLTNLYTATPKVDISTNDVTVTVELERNEEDLPAVLNWINFPPKKLNPIRIVMPLETAK